MSEEHTGQTRPFCQSVIKSAETPIPIRRGSRNRRRMMIIGAVLVVASMGLVGCPGYCNTYSSGHAENRKTCSRSAGVAPESSLRWAENLLAKASPHLNRSHDILPDLPRRYLRDAANAFRRILAKYGPNPRAYMGLGEAQIQLGKYANAAQSFGEAAAMTKKNEKARWRKGEAERFAQIASFALKVLPKGESVVRVLYFPAAGKGSWLVLSAETIYANDAMDYYYRAMHVRLSVFKESASQIRRVWRSDQIRYSDSHGFYGELEFTDLQLYLIDLTGDGIPEVVVSGMCLGASWVPSHTEVFDWRKGRMVCLLRADSVLGLDLSDLNHDGKYEATTMYEVGVDMCHAEQPCWQDIYAYKDGRYVLADSDFPKEYSGFCKKLQRTLKRYPNDVELPKYLGMSYEIQGQRRMALRYYRLAEERQKALYDRLLHDKQADPDATMTPLSELKDIRNRIHTVKQGRKSL